MKQQELIEKIVGYLPYKLKVYSEDQKSKTDTIIGIFMNTFDFENWSPMNSKIDKFKLVLKPLSMLVEEIEPELTRLESLMSEIGGELSDNIKDFVSAFIERTSDEDMVYMINQCPKILLEILYKEMYDVNGLIKSGHAISIKEVEK